MCFNNMNLCWLFQPQPEDHVGAGEAQGRAREAQNNRPGEEPQAARAHVCHTHSCLNRGLKTNEQTNKHNTCDVLVNEDFVVQGDAGQKGAGQTRPEGSGGDSGELPNVLFAVSVPLKQ